MKLGLVVKYGSTIGTTGGTKLNSKSLQLTITKVNHRGLASEVKTSFISERRVARLADSLKKLNEAIIVVDNQVLI